MSARTFWTAFFHLVFGKQRRAKVVQRDCCFTASDQAHAPGCAS